MSITALEGVVIDGQIRLTTSLHLPDHTKVYVIIPDLAPAPVARIVSPRLVHREHFADFRKEVVEDQPDASV